MFSGVVEETSGMKWVNLAYKISYEIFRKAISGKTCLELTEVETLKNLSK